MSGGSYEGDPNRPCALCLTAIVQNSGRPVDPDWGTDHRQRHSDIVGVCLDVEIADLVERLHQIGVRTEHSCEGYPDAEDPEHPYIMVANTAEEAHDLISKFLPEINTKTAYSSYYTFGVNEKANGSWRDYYKTKLTFPLGIPNVDKVDHEQEPRGTGT